MANSKTGICNLASGWLGGKHIISVDDDTSLEARLCKANYDPSRQAVLEDREWTFATKRAALTPLAASPDFGYNYQFLVPSDSLRILGVYDPSQSGNPRPETISYVIEENMIQCDLASIHIRYTFDQTNTTRFSALFGQALAAHIAANIATSLTESSTKQADMLLLYEDKVSKAAASDGTQGTRERLNISQLEKSRRMFVGLE